MNSHFYHHNLTALNTKQLLFLSTWKENTLYVARYLKIQHIFQQIIFIYRCIFLKQLLPPKTTLQSIHLSTNFFLKKKKVIVSGIIQSFLVLQSLH